MENRRLSQQHPRSLDGIVRRPKTASVRLAVNSSQKPLAKQQDGPKRYMPQPQPMRVGLTLGSRRQKRIKSFKNFATYIGIIILAVVVGTALVDVRVGQWLIAACGIATLVFRVNSRIVFGAALFCLAMVPAMTIASQPGLSENYALYAFIFLSTGTIRASVETANSRGKKAQAL